MSSPGTESLGAALEGALRMRQPTRTIGSAIWLYLALLVAANGRGLIMRTRDRLAKDLTVAESEIDGWLSRLSDASLIAIKSPSPYLVIALRFWSGDRSSKDRNLAENTGFEPEPIEEVPGNSSAIAIAIQAIPGEGGTGEGDLLARVREILGQPADVDLEAILRVHAPERVARVLERVAKTPDNKIRKSRLALFRYLLGKMNEHTHVPSSTQHPEH